MDSSELKKCAERETFLPDQSNILELHMLEVVGSHYILRAGYSGLLSECVQDC